MSIVATYDNPKTMMREAHVDGQIIMAMSLKLMEVLPDDFVWPMEVNVGPWKEGQIVGDPNAVDHNWGNR